MLCAAGKEAVHQAYHIHTSPLLSPTHAELLARNCHARSGSDTGSRRSRGKSTSQVGHCIIPSPRAPPCERRSAKASRVLTVPSHTHIAAAQRWIEAAQVSHQKASPGGIDPSSIAHLQEQAAEDSSWTSGPYRTLAGYGMRARLTCRLPGRISDECATCQRRTYPLWYGWCTTAYDDQSPGRPLALVRAALPLPKPGSARKPGGTAGCVSASLLLEDHTAVNEVVHKPYGQRTRGPDTQPAKPDMSVSCVCTAFNRYPLRQRCTTPMIRQAWLIVCAVPLYDAARGLGRANRGNLYGRSSCS
jgi:hypothetical protein